MKQLLNVGLESLVIALAAYGLSVVCLVDAMARRAFRGNYAIYMATFLIVSTVALFVLSLIEHRRKALRQFMVGLLLRIAICCVASWSALILLSYRLASRHNRESLEFMRPGIHVAIGIYLSGAIFYGICLALMSICVAHLAENPRITEPFQK